MARALSAAVAIASLSNAPNAWADASLVTIVKPSSKDALVAEATTRLKAEIEAAGFRVRVVEAKTEGDGRAQVEEATGAESFATIAILATGKGAAADVWVADNVTKKTVVRRVDVAAPSATFASDLAVRSVELLRASLLEANAPDRRKDLPPDVAAWIAPAAAPSPTPTSSPPVSAFPPPEEPAPSGPTRMVEAPSLLRAPRSAPLAPPKRGAFVSASVALLGSGDLAASIAPLVRVGYAFRAPFALRVSEASSSEATLSFDEGNVRVRQDLFTLDATTGFWLESAPVHPVLAIGAGAYHLRMSGDARAPYVSEVHDLWAFALEAGTGASVAMGDRLSLVAEGDLAWLAPAPVVAVADVERARAGRPLLLGSLGLAASFR